MKPSQRIHSPSQRGRSFPTRAHSDTHSHSHVHFHAPPYAPPHIPSPPSPPPHTPPPTLRLGTFNVGCGFVRKIPLLVHRCLSLCLDVVALQEIGTPTLFQKQLLPYRLIFAPGPSNHQAGVGLLLSQALITRVRAYKRSSTGRLVGAIIEINHGHQLLVVSAYMPSGLDHAAAGDPIIQQARALYDEILQWSEGMQQVIVLGDLNSTRLPHLERIPRAASAHTRPQPMDVLTQQGFTDVYRHLHPNPRSHPGFTHSIHTHARSTYSRLDYAWCRGFDAASMLHANIDRTLREKRLSHHHLVYLSVRLESAAPLLLTSADQLPRPQLPNLRKATQEHYEDMSQQLQDCLLSQHADLLSLATSNNPASLDLLATHLTSAVRAASLATLPLSFGDTHKSRDVLDLQRQRRDLIRLDHITSTLLSHRDGASPTRSPEFLHLFAHCQQQHGLVWTHDAAVDLNSWRAEAAAHLQQTRSQLRAQQKHMRHQQSTSSSFDASPAATVNRMLKNDALPSELSNVVDSDGNLTATPQELEDVMVQHFKGVFSIHPPPPRRVRDDSEAVPHMLLDKQSVSREWYDPLMREVTEAELSIVLRDVPLVSAAGSDQVSSGVWKMAIAGSEEVRSLVCALFNACLSASSFPAAWKHSIIVPLIKDQHKEKTMNNIRPISLQSCLGKLLNKLLAHRLSDIFSRHPILNTAQRGFIHGGTTTKCIDELLDAWEWSRKGHHELHTLFYDIKQAYDSVQKDVMLRALRRLRLPESFVHLVGDSLSGLSSCVRTPYGLTRNFDVLRSLRQGDPLAPLLFVILMDALHDGLEVNPFSGQRYGCNINILDRVIALPSLGYADDTTVLAASLESMTKQNQWVIFFMAFNKMRLNPSKCELVGWRPHRDADGNMHLQAITAADTAAHHLTVEDQTLQPLSMDRPIRYLGLHIRGDGDWSAQTLKSINMVNLFTSTASKFSVTVSQATYMFNVFLLPKLELALRYVHGAQGTVKAWLTSLDRVLIGCIKHLSGAALRLSHSIVASCTGLILPSWLEATSKVSEMFLRLNSLEPRWAGLGRMLAQHHFPADMNSDSAACSVEGRQHVRMLRTVRLAVDTLKWSLHLRRPVSRIVSAAAADNNHPLFVEPGQRQTLSGSSVQHIHLSRHSPERLALKHNAWSGWGESLTPPVSLVHVYTDGSHVKSLSSSAVAAAVPRATGPAMAPPPPSSSSWAVVVSDAWLEQHHAQIPSDEQLLTVAHVDGAVAMFGSAISDTCTQGVYAAELQAIARALAMVPLSASIHIHTDSEASIKAITSYMQQTNERKRLRMSCRPLLQLIHHLMAARSAFSDARLSHVKAHTTDSDIDSVGNRLADYQANVVRARPNRPSPLQVQPLPIQQCEHYLRIDDEKGIMIIEDIRRATLKRLRSLAVAKWRAKPLAQGQYYFAHASDALVQLSRVVLQQASETVKLL